MREAALHEVSVIVVLHNSGDVVGDCVAALPPEVEVVAVDNASSDDGPGAVAAARSDVVVIFAPGNLGFGSGCQLGADAATRQNLLFLNPDARIGGEAIARLVRTLARHPCGIVGPRLLDADGRARKIRHNLDIRRDAFELLPFAERWLPERFRRQPEPDRDAEYEVAYVEGACFLMRAEDLTSIGGFDTDLFLYFEEPSLAHRLRRRGGVTWYEPRATATHVGATSTGKVGVFAKFHFYRSRVMFERKVFGDAPGRLRSLILLAAGAFSVVRAVALWLLPGPRGAVREAVAVVRGTIAGMRDPIDPRYR